MRAKKFSRVAVSFTLLKQTNCPTTPATSYLCKEKGYSRSAGGLHFSCVKQPGPQLLKKLSKYLGSKGILLLKLCHCALSLPYKILRVEDSLPNEGASCSRQSSRNPEFLPSCRQHAVALQGSGPAPTGVRPISSSVQHFSCFLVSSPVLPILYYLHTSVPPNMALQSLL